MSQIDIETGGATKTSRHWVSDFCVPQNGECDYTLPYYIWKVPDHFRLNNKHFEPRTWRFGLHNRSLIHAEVADEIKMSLVGGLRLSGKQWFEFCDAVVPHPREVQLMYGKCDPAVQSLNVEEIRKLLTLDALFLVAFLLHVGFKELEQPLSAPSFCSVLRTHFFAGYETPVWFDVCLVENQIPLKLLSNVISWLRGMSESDCNRIPLWSDKFWRRTIFRLATKHFANRNVEVHEKLWDEQFKKCEENFLEFDRLSPGRGMGIYEHILDIVSRNLNGQNYLESELLIEVFKRIPSASTLKKAGVTFKSNSSSSLDKFSFRREYSGGCLEIPYNYLYDGTEQRFRNLVLYEVLKNDTQSTIRSYTLLMGDLIRTEEDERILVDAGVIGNGLGRSNAHEMWKEIHRNVDPPRITQALSKTLDSIHKFSRSRRNRYWVEFKETKCSRPWVCFSAFVVTLVTICTGIQTYVAVIGSNGMKPHFP